MKEASCTIIPPPVKGWNTRDPISSMDPEYALDLENWFPKGSTVDLRKGYTQHVSTASGSGYTHLAELVNTAGTHFLVGFGVAGVGGPGIPYNVTSAGSGTLITGGFTTGSIETYTVNFRGRLFAKGYVNTNDILSTDGTAATLSAFTGPGGDDKDLWRLAIYKNRLYALTISDASVWYGGVDAVTGAMLQFDFQSLLSLGGKPWYIGSFSMTGGDVSQAYFLLISEQGEILLYQGDNPGSATWSIVGQYFIPPPVGRKAFFNWGSDVLVITYEGVVSISEVITSKQGEYSYLTDAISSAFKDAVASTSASYVNLIQGIVYPKGQYLLINFYSSTPASTTQYVMNTQTRSWCKFVGQRAICWSLLNNNLYFGAVTDGSASYVALADNGYFDEDPSNAGQVLTRTIKLRHAYNYFEDATRVKQFTEAQPIIYQSEGLDLTLDINVDYADTTATSRLTDTSDTAYKLYRPYMGLNGLGTAGSIRIDGTVTTKRASLQATKVFWNAGGYK